MDDQTFPSIPRITKDLRKTVQRMDRNEILELVKKYYACQRNRIRSCNQLGAAEQSKQPHEALEWLAQNDRLLEERVKTFLSAYVEAHPLGDWLQSIYGIGPVISACYLATIDLHKAPTVGHIWRYAGLDPTVIWKQAKHNLEDLKSAGYNKQLTSDDILNIASKYGRHPKTLFKFMDGDFSLDKASKALARRPYNAMLKVTCWKMVNVFIKFKDKPECFYGQLYTKRKIYEIDRNEKGGNAEYAKNVLPKFKNDTESRKCYLEGKLPPAHVNNRAIRWTAQIFLSHYHQVGRSILGLPVPAPYVCAFLKHTHIIDPPGWAAVLPDFSQRAR